MKYIIIFLLSLFSVPVMAQLPSNPWTTRSPVQDRLNNSIVTTRESEAVRVRQGIGDSPGERDHYKIDRTQFTGEATTWGEAYGQEMIAPEVNRHNMIVMLEHLRNMGYNIPDSYDEKIKAMPSEYKATLQQSLIDVTDNAGDDPLSLMFTNMYNIMEDYTGLDFNNILMNTMDILGTD